MIQLSTAAGKALLNDLGVRLRLGSINRGKFRKPVFPGHYLEVETAIALEGDGEARPLPGASGDGRASYFPRYSPDGRWIAFVRSDGGYFARPSSDLFLVPASGGDARRLSVNTSGRMDSWPSWSLDGHWLVWASRRDDSPNTRVFFTEIDPTGGCSPPVPFPGHVPEGMSVNHPTISSFPRPAKLLVD